MDGRRAPGGWPSLLGPPWAPLGEGQSATHCAPIEHPYTGQGIRRRIACQWGRTRHFGLPRASDGLAILDAAQEAGVDLPYACKGGVCCTCKARVIEGSVRMDVNYALEKDEVEAGYILTCQAHPTSAKVIVSFDE